MSSTTLARSFAVLPLIVFAPGCFWPGHVLSRSEIEYAHPSVRWVYQTGGQVGNVLYLITPIQNALYDLQAAENQVLIQEGPHGCLEGGPWRPKYALDLRTGRPALTSYRRSDRPSSYVGAVGNSYDLDPRTRLYFPGQYPHRELFAGRPDHEPQTHTRILALRSVKSGLGGVGRVIRPREDTIVFSTGDDYIICLDLSKLPNRGPATGPE